MSKRNVRDISSIARGAVTLSFAELFKVKLWFLGLYAESGSQPLHANADRARKTAPVGEDMTR